MKKFFVIIPTGISLVYTRQTAATSNTASQTAFLQKANVGVENITIDYKLIDFERLICYKSLRTTLTGCKKTINNNF